MRGWSPGICAASGPERAPLLLSSRACPPGSGQGAFEQPARGLAPRHEPQRIAPALGQGAVLRVRKPQFEPHAGPPGHPLEMERRRGDPARQRRLEPPAAPGCDPQRKRAAAHLLAVDPHPGQMAPEMQRAGGGRAQADPSSPALFSALRPPALRAAAADLDFERAARLRDEIRRLRETELAIADDPLAREVELESPASGREKGRHNKGRARHRTVDEAGSGLFRKPDLDEMGTSGDHATPAGPGLFRRNTLDEMTVGRTEKPVRGNIPQKPDSEAKPVKRERAGIGSYEDPADIRKETRRSRKTGRPGR